MSQKDFPENNAAHVTPGVERQIGRYWEGGRRPGAGAKGVGWGGWVSGWVVWWEGWGGGSKVSAALQRLQHPQG